MGLFLSRTARRRLLAAGVTPPEAGKLAIGEIAAARALAHQLVRAAPPAAGAAPSAGRLHALALLESLFQRVIDRYLAERRADLLTGALAALEDRLGRNRVHAILTRFAAEFGLGAESGRGRAEWTEPGVDQRGRLLRELLVFWLLDANPAARPLVRLLHGEEFSAGADFARFTAALGEYLASQRSFREEEGTLLDFLLEPARRSPDSLAAQLRLVLARWRYLLTGEVPGLLAGLDLLAEEEAVRLPPGPGPPAEVPSFSELAGEERRFTADRDWMPRLVLLAKNTYVWLDQLGRAHGQPIRRLDEIPETALADLARRGINGLWLIGLWRRSVASARIKQLCGNPQAAASAYSLAGYQIDEELGGDAALETLRRRAARHGLRLAADMVPNHMGIDSSWVLEHPDRFISAGEPPFPAYTFDGPDLSPDPSVGIFLEDHYYDRTDAAVVFQRVDRRSGRERYLYHGNDGTSMPWNDTAQLDYLQPEVRRAVLEQVLAVARRFSIVRFDAAMTLARAHFQRLWYPEPGSGGAIPSRAEHAIPAEEFDRRMPREFWREVVDRVAREAPDTLLVAEAFWLMEGYFVRTLGMHRVYNSAFMNMLRDGETAKYRRLIKETLAFDPGILQRYVNFMSNPDERTAVEQFGSGDRYFGVCLLMATLPGTPMFAHGQFEGLAEKYGMEYRRAYRDEESDPELISRHEREITPQLRRRALFAGVGEFLLFDLVRGDGTVDEDVIAFSNSAAGERVVVLFNNRHGPARGRLHRSAPHRRPGTAGDDPPAQTRTLAEALGVEGGDGGLLHYRDSLAGLEFLQGAAAVAEGGLEIELGPFGRLVLEGFAIRGDEEDGIWSRVAASLAGRGVSDLGRARAELELSESRQGFREELSPALLRDLIAAPAEDVALRTEEGLLTRLEGALMGVGREAARWAGNAGAVTSEMAELRRRLVALITLPLLAERLAASRDGRRRGAGLGLERSLAGNPEIRAALFVAVALAGGGRLAAARLEESDLCSAWGLASDLGGMLAAAGMEEGRAGRVGRGLALASRAGWGASVRRTEGGAALLEELLADAAVREELGVHRHKGTDYLVREHLEDLLRLRLWLEILAWNGSDERSPAEVPAAVTEWWEAASQIVAWAGAASYRLAEMRRLARPAAEPGDTGAAGPESPSAG